MKQIKLQDMTVDHLVQRFATGLMSPRDYLRGKSWEERMQVGHDALIDVGVLKR